MDHCADLLYRITDSYRVSLILSDACFLYFPYFLAVNIYAPVKFFIPEITKF